MGNYVNALQVNDMLLGGVSRGLDAVVGMRRDMAVFVEDVRYEGSVLRLRGRLRQFADVNSKVMDENRELRAQVEYFQRLTTELARMCDEERVRP